MVRDLPHPTHLRQDHDLIRTIVGAMLAEVDDLSQAIATTIQRLDTSPQLLVEALATIHVR